MQDLGTGMIFIVRAKAIVKQLLHTVALLDYYGANGALSSAFRSQYGGGGGTGIASKCSGWANSCKTSPSNSSMVDAQNTSGRSAK